jgi:nitric oxide dioxygenase
LRIVVRRVRGTRGAPDGAVSTHLHDHVRTDDTLLVGPPAGDTALDPGDGPVLLVSAGIGVTPMASMLDHLARTQPTRRVVVVHAERGADRHALRAEIDQAVHDLADVDQLTWYEDGHGRPGRVDVDVIPLDEGTTAYLCGPVPFMREVRAGLLHRGLPADRVRYEVFGPGMLDGRAG